MPQNGKASGKLKVAGENSMLPMQSPVVHSEDLASKFAMQFFAAELLQYLGIRARVTRIMPTELVHLEVKHMYEDFNFETEDGSWYHVEFESDSIGTDDLRRFRAYEAVTSQTYRVPVITYVLCSSGVKRPMSSIREGINTYHVRVVRMKGKSADAVFSELKKKSGDEMTKADLVPVVFTPLMGGSLSAAERAGRGMRILNGRYRNVAEEDLRRMQAALMVLANKFLTQAEMKKVKEMCGMNAFFQLFVEDGIEQGIQQGIQKGSDAVLALVACMQNDEEDAGKIPLLKADPELRKRMMEKYQIAI